MTKITTLYIKSDDARSERVRYNGGRRIRRGQAHDVFYVQYNPARNQ